MMQMACQKDRYDGGNHLKAVKTSMSYVSRDMVVMISRDEYGNDVLKELAMAELTYQREAMPRLRLMRCSFTK